MVRILRGPPPFTRSSTLCGDPYSCEKDRHLTCPQSLCRSRMWSSQLSLLVYVLQSILSGPSEICDLVLGLCQDVKIGRSEGRLEGKDIVVPLLRVYFWLQSCLLGDFFHSHYSRQNILHPILESFTIFDRIVPNSCEQPLAEPDIVKLTH